MDGHRQRKLLNGYCSATPSLVMDRWRHHCNCAKHWPNVFATKWSTPRNNYQLLTQLITSHRIRRNYSLFQRSIVVWRTHFSQDENKKSQSNSICNRRKLLFQRNQNNIFSIKLSTLFSLLLKSCLFCYCCCFFSLSFNFNCFKYKCLFCFSLAFRFIFNGRQNYLLWTKINKTFLWAFKRKNLFFK